jgi:hypothetical protein
MVQLRQAAIASLLQWSYARISRFFGIIMRVFMEVGVPHHVPHFSSGVWDCF